MAEELTIAVAQPRLTTGELAANAGRHAEAVIAAGARIVVFPELSLTGYDLSADLVDPSDTRLSPIEVACARTRTLALVGAPVAGMGDDGPSIAMLAIGPAGDDQRARPRVVYRKSHLGEAEAQRFAAGVGPAVIEVDGWRVGLGICKDTGMAEHVEGVAELGVDLYVAGLVDHPEALPEQERRAQWIGRATGAPVAFASHAGPTGEGYDPTAGGSAIWSAGGQRLASAADAPGAIVTATLGVTRSASK
ncbi:MAG: carbon-nitrogen hydrolase family protein [Solirubrobacteraceae bacterium]|nr:carbon-nitrogen hydrolase family protein [Solirubrobacteraceae bacterium]